MGFLKEYQGLLDKNGVIIDRIKGKFRVKRNNFGLFYYKLIQRGTNLHASSIKFGTQKDVLFYFKYLFPVYKRNR